MANGRRGTSPAMGPLRRQSDAVRTPMCSGVMIHARLQSDAEDARRGGTAVPPPIGDHGWVKRPVRRGFVVLLPYVLATAIAYGMVASALTVPLAYRGQAAGGEPDCRLDAASHADHVQLSIEPRSEHDARGRASRTRDRDAHAGHPGPAAPATPPTDGDRRPTPDHFECCTTRLGTVGTPAVAMALVRRLEPRTRRVRVAQPRMPSRPRPWRVTLGRQPPLPSTVTTLAA
jgi:hypothetical protein